MNGVVGQVEEEGGVFVALDEIDGLVGEEVGEVFAFGVFDRWLSFKIEVLAHGHDGFVKAALPGVIGVFFAEVPFAEHAGGVSGLLHRLRDGD